MKRLLLVALALVCLGCSKDEDKSQTAVDPIVSLPPSVACSSVPFYKHGEFGPPDPRLLKTLVEVPGYKSSDILNVRYKSTSASTWIDLAAGNQSQGISYTVSGETVTLVYLHVNFWEWQIEALVTTCN